MKRNAAQRDRRFTVKAWHAVLAAVLLLVAGAVGLYLVLGGTAVERRLAALRTAGYPTSMAEWAESHKLPEGVENAADVYEQAFSLLVCPPEEANVPVLGWGKLPDRGMAWPAGTVKDVVACLAESRQCLARLRAAAGIEHCWYNWNPAAGQHDFGGLRLCARLLDLEMLYHAQKGDTDAAVTSFRTGLRLAESARSEPMLLTYLGARSCSVIVLLAGLERVLSATPLTDEQLRELDRILAQTVASLDLTEVLVGERCWVIEMCRDPQLFGNNVGQGGIIESAVVKKNGLLDMLDYMADGIEASKLPSTQRLARFRAIDDQVQGLFFWHVVIKRVPPQWAGTAALHLRLLAQLDLARAALAVERYRLATGKVPEQLEELVPLYTKQVPLDPFDGQPIRYRRTAPGYLLYSILEDGQDNGGRQKAGIDDTVPYDGCFVVTP